MNRQPPNPEMIANRRLITLIMNVFKVGKDEAEELAELSRIVSMENLRETMAEEDRQAKEQIHRMIKARHPHLAGVEELQ